MTSDGSEAEPQNSWSAITANLAFIPLASIRGSAWVMVLPREVDHGVGGWQVGAAGLPSFSTVEGSWSGRVPAMVGVR
jgi:hypothetical protein